MARPRARAGGAKTAKAAAASAMAATNQEKGWSKTWVLQAQVIQDKADLKKKVEHLDLHQADLVMGRFAYLKDSANLTADLRRIMNMVDAHRVICFLFACFVES